MVDLKNQNFEIIREKFIKILEIPEDKRSESNLSELMTLTANFKIFDCIKYSQMHKEICHKMKIQSFEKSNIIFKQGDYSEGYYYVLKGSIDLYKYDIDLIDGKTKFKYVTSIGTGNGFGELAFLYNSSRSATAVSNCRSDLLVIGKKLYSKNFKDLHENELIKIVQFFHSIPIFKKEPISNIVKYALRTNKKVLYTHQPFLRFKDYINEYLFINTGSIKAYAKILVNKLIIKNAPLIPENSFVEQMKNLQKRNYKLEKEYIHNMLELDPKEKKKKEKDFNQIYYEIVDIMEFKDKDLLGEYFASRTKRIDTYFLPIAPTEIFSISTEDLKNINPHLHEAIVKFSSPILEPERIFRKLHHTILWKRSKSKFIYDAIKKKK